jgi:hypothetical protein
MISDITGIERIKAKYSRYPSLCRDTPFPHPQCGEEGGLFGRKLLCAPDFTFQTMIDPVIPPQAAGAVGK